MTLHANDDGCWMPISHQLECIQPRMADPVAGLRSPRYALLGSACRVDQLGCVQSCEQHPIHTVINTVL